MRNKHFPFLVGFSLFKVEFKLYLECEFYFKKKFCISLCEGLRINSGFERRDMQGATTTQHSFLEWGSGNIWFNSGRIPFVWD